MTTSLAYLLFEDENLKTNKPLPETSSDDFVINNALLSSLRNTLNDKVIAKLPEAQKVKAAINALQTKDDISDAEKNNLENDIKPIINDPLGAFSKGDLIRLSTTAQNVSRIGPVVFDVAQMKTGKSQIKGFTGIDLELMKQSQIIPFMVMTKEGKVLSGDSTSKGEFGIIFLAPAYYAKIDPKNVPIYQELFPEILSEQEVDGKKVQIASNKIENVILPAAPFNTDTEKFIQGAFRNTKLLPALIGRLEKAYRSNKQNINFDVTDDGESLADQQDSIVTTGIAASVFENSSMICKQGISSLILENDASESDRLNVLNNGQKLNNTVMRNSTLAEIKDEFFKFNRNLYKKEFYSLPENFDDLFHLAFEMKQSLFGCYMIAHRYGFKDMLNNFGFYDEALNSNLKENIKLAFKVDNLFQEKFEKAKQGGKDLTKDMFTDIEKGEALNFTIHFNKHIATHFSKIFATDDKRLVIELLEKAMKVPDKRGWQDVFRAGGSKDVAKLFKKLESHNKDNLGPEFIQYLMYAIKNKKKIKLEAKVHKNRIISEAANFSVGKGIIRSIWRHLSDIGLDEFADQIRRAMFWNVVDENEAKIFENKLQDIDAQIQDQEQGEQGENQEEQGENQEEQDENQEEQGDQGEEKKEVDYKDFDDKFNTELDKALSKAKLEIEKYDDVQKVSKSNPRINEIRNWLRFIGQQGKVDKIYDRLTEIDTDLAEDIRGNSQDRATIKDKSFGDVGEILLINIASLYDLIVKGLKIEITPGDPFLNRIQRYAELQSLIGNNSYSGESKSELVNLIEQDLEGLFSKDSRFFFAEQIVNVIDSEETKKAFLSKTKEVKDKFINLFTRSLNSSTQDDTFKSIQKTPPYLAYLAKKLDMELREMFSKHLIKEQPQTIAILMSCIQPVFGLEKVYNSLIAGYYGLQVETQVEVAVRYASLDTVDNNTLQAAIIALGNNIAKRKNLGIEITKEELDKFGEDCKVIYGVPVEEEEVRDEHINDICEYMQRKIIQESDRERYEKAVAKAAADFEKQKTKKYNAESVGFITGGLASLAIGAGLGFATGGLSAAVPLVASIIGCPFAAIGTGMVTGSLYSGPKKKKVTQSELSDLIERKAKQSSKILKRIILNQVKAATVVENKYIHLKNNSLAKLMFEEADFDFADSGTDVKKSSTKKRQIERKSLEAMLEQKKFLVYDKSLEGTALDTLGLKNEFIESLNSILDYYYNTTIVGVVSKKSAFETIKDVKIDNAVNEKIESVGKEATTKAVVETAVSSAKFANSEASEDEIKKSVLKNVTQVFEAKSLARVIKSTDIEEELRAVSFASITSDNVKAIQHQKSTSTVSNINQNDTDNSEETVSAGDIIKTLDIYKEYNEFLNENSYHHKTSNLGMKNRTFNSKTPVDIDGLKIYAEDNELVFILGDVTADDKYHLALIGVVYNEMLYYYDMKNTDNILDLSINATQEIADYLNKFITLKRYFLVIENDNSNLSQDLIKKLKDSNKSKLASSVLTKMISLSEPRKESNDYVLGSLTNLLFESDLKRSKDFYNKSKNKKQELSNLREEWLNIWDIYK